MMSEKEGGQVERQAIKEIVIKQYGNDGSGEAFDIGHCTAMGNLLRTIDEPQENKQ